jgi:hypothetical protein
MQFDQLKRREFITLLDGAAVGRTNPLPASARRAAGPTCGVWEGLGVGWRNKASK